MWESDEVPTSGEVMECVDQSEVPGWAREGSWNIPELAPPPRGTRRAELGAPEISILEGSKRNNL